MPKYALFLLHLSDIHFSHDQSGLLDLDTEIRNQLERDCERVVRDTQSADAILVTGDIAYSGSAEQYETAQKWLESLTVLVGCEPDNVLLVPGNHDIDRSKVAANPILRMLHKNLRGVDTGTIDSNLADLIRHAESFDTLHSPLRDFNQFAARYSCEFSPNQQYWERDFPLNDGSVLRIRGLNSTLISDELDDNAQNKLILGSYQINFEEYDNVEYITLCHHPPQWLRDEDNAENILKARVRIQLFGHKHHQVLDEINKCIRLTAGAVHPNRQEREWEPRYNFIGLRVDTQDGLRALSIDVIPRIWNKEERSFAPHADSAGSHVRSYEFPLQSWEPADTTVRTGIEEEGSENAQALPTQLVTAMNPARRLTYRYFGLPYHIRHAIAQELGLVSDDDQNLSEVEIFRSFFKRAHERALLHRLWTEVQRRTGYPEGEANPFEGQ